MPTLRTSALCLALTVAVTVAQQPAPKWSPDLLEPASERTVGAEPVALPRPEGDLPARYEVRLVASRTQGTGSLAVTVRDAAGETHRLFVEGNTSLAKVTFYWIVDHGRIEAGSGTVLTKAGKQEENQAGAPAGGAWTVHASGAEFRLDGLRWRKAAAARPAPAPATRPQAPARAKPDLMARLASRDRWSGTLSADRGKPQDCTLVVLEHTATRFVFRLENERGGWFRFECAIEDGKPTVTRVVHTKRPGGGPRGVLSEEKGRGRLNGDRFELDFSYTCRINGTKNTSTGRITVPLPAAR